MTETRAEQGTPKRGLSIKWTQGLVAIIAEDDGVETEYPMRPDMAESLGKALRKAAKKAIK